MPIFDYHCTECNTIYDIFHKGKEIIEDIHCPVCDSTKYKKLISVPSIISKGVPPTPCNEGVCGMDKSCCGNACGIN